jgi:hypothetical protein
MLLPKKKNHIRSGFFYTKELRNATEGTETTVNQLLNFYGRFIGFLFPVVSTINAICFTLFFTNKSLLLLLRLVNLDYTDVISTFVNMPLFHAA